MKIAVGSDHAGYELKTEILQWVRDLGHEVQDLGTNSTASVDYPDFACAVGTVVAAGQADRGIVVCGSGAGASIAANKLPGIRAALCHDTYTAHQCVEHDDVNVLTVGSRVIGPALAQEIVTAFLGANFTHEERHERRLNKVKQIEADHLRRS